jgi:hypothetical protein
MCRCRSAPVSASAGTSAPSAERAASLAWLADDGAASAWSVGAGQVGVAGVVQDVSEGPGEPDAFVELA